MMRMNGCWAMLAAAALIAGCGKGDETAVGGVSPEEAAQLNNAAEILDASPDGMAAPEGMPMDSESGANVEANMATNAAE